MSIEEIKEKLVRPATKFIIGGFKPTNSIEESWIGKVSFYKENEEIPKDENGKLMLPLAQLYLPSLPYCHPLLKNTKFLTVFMLNNDHNFPEPFEEMGRNWLIREYDSIEDLLRKDLTNPDSYLKPFPLKPEYSKTDYPLWDSGEISSDIEDEVMRLEDEGEIDSYYDIFGADDHIYTHKIGGYPSFCQSGIDFGEGFEFVFQISSDEKVGLNVVDSGSLMFAKHNKTGEWKLYYDFH